MAWQLRDAPQTDFAHKFFGEILQLTSESKVRRGILLASQTSAEVPFQEVAKSLGYGSLVTAPDTVPFCIWMAAHHPRHFVEAIGKTISVGGDCDTNAANQIVRQSYIFKVHKSFAVIEKKHFDEFIFADIRDFSPEWFQLQIING
jgi:hypothetical protein